jgi:hypothetical protein
MMAQKINGYVNQKVVDEYPTRGHIGVLADEELFFASEHKRACTVVVHEGQPELVFTDSEVSNLFTRLRASFFEGELTSGDFEAEVATFLAQQTAQPNGPYGPLSSDNTTPSEDGVNEFRERVLIEADRRSRRISPDESSHGE